MRILMLHHDPDGGLGGASHMAWRTADALADRGHEVALAGTVPATGNGRRRLAPTAQRLGPDLPRTAADVTDRAGWTPDVVHVTDLADPAAAVRGLRLARAYGAVFALTPATDATLWTDRDGAREAARQADVVFALTPTEREALTEVGVPPGRLAHLGQGPQLSGTPDAEAFRARVSAEGPLVLFLGRKLPTKGPQHLVGAAPAILARHPDATIVVAGPDPTTSVPVPATDPDDSGVHHLGPLDEVEKYSALLAADLLCLPSTADAFPLVFVEAWWCRTPVVSGPFPGATEVVRHGLDGVVTTADPAGVASAVVDLLDSPGRLRAMAEAGRVRAETELSWGAVAADVERGYAEVSRRRTDLAVAGPATTTGGKLSNSGIAADHQPDVHAEATWRK